MSTTIRKDNTGDPVEYEVTINKIVEVSSSYTTTRQDVGQAPVDHVQVITMTQKALV